jgi:undecaprenyl-diphosphatase
MRDVAHHFPRLSVLVVSIFALITAGVVLGWSQGIDDAWNTAMITGESPVLVSVAEAFHWLGSASPVLVTAILVAAVLTASRQWTYLVAWVAMVGIAQILSSATKALIGRARPIEALVVESSAAYPSGHAMVAGMTMAVGLAMIAASLWPHRRRWLLGSAAIYAVLMAWSRTYLRAHWLTDVVGGLLFGAATVLVVMWLVLSAE